MAQVSCEVGKGLRESEATVMVKDVDGSRHFLPVDREFLTTEDGRSYLPVVLLYVDEGKSAALIQLPGEADSGTSRIWVRLDSLRRHSETPA